ncbi:hypothetical protein CMI48_02465 [Candidatus Pacearchaeota archaeon]|nr:hypothetical protein [Candidatus Pacearchaeota archaeon]|tara:strand:+ start:113 stop:688 length:576 start_codon:yes stop_codon:yes gene_type:complete
MSKRTPWQTEEQWIQHGLDHCYNESNPSSLEKSKNKTERSWYSKGQREKWINKLNFNRKNLISSKGLTNLLETEPRAQAALSLVQGDQVDLADILAVIYEGRITNKQAQKLLRAPSIRDYIGEYQPAENIADLVNTARELIPLDKEGILEDIIKRRIRKQVEYELGTNPTLEQRTEILAYLAQLENELAPS